MSDGIGCQCYARCSSECGCENVDWTPREVIELRNQLSHLQKLCDEQKAELDEMNALIALQRTRYGVAEKWWRSRKPVERELQSPDLGQLLDELMGVIEEQKGEIRELMEQMERGLDVDRMGVQVRMLESQLARLNLVLEGYKVMAGLSTTDHLKVQGMIQKELEEQMVEIERLKALGLGGTIQDILRNSERLYSQLATQTERVRVLEVAIADIRGLHARCQQCGITSGEDECVTYQLAEQALNQKELK